jgi:hypothetical protein
MTGPSASVAGGKNESDRVRYPAPCPDRTVLAWSGKDWRPQCPQKPDVENERDSLRPGYPDMVIGQKLTLQKQQHENGEDDQCRQGDRLQDDTEHAAAHVRRPSENLHENIARQQPAEVVAYFFWRTAGRRVAFSGAAL